MSRIANEVAAAREQHAWDLFTSAEAPSVRAVNEALFAADGFKMSLNRIYELKRAAAAGLPFPVRVPKPKKQKSEAAYNDEAA